MMKTIVWLTALTALLAASLTSAGCASSTALEEMVARVPRGVVSFRYVDVAAIRGDPELSGLHDSWKAAVGARLEAHGINPADVNVFALGTSATMRCTLLEGCFDVEGVRGSLKDRGFDRGEYKGVEMWEMKAGSGYDSDPGVALMGGLIILGNESGVKGCIKVIREGDASLLNKADVKQVVGRLPAGLYVDLERSALIGLIVKGFEAYGLSAQKGDSDTLSIAGVVKFEDEDDADGGRSALQTLMETMFEDVDVSQNGEFLKATARIDVDRTAFMFSGL